VAQPGERGRSLVLAEFIDEVVQLLAVGHEPNFTFGGPYRWRMELAADPPEAYLGDDPIIERDASVVRALAAGLAEMCPTAEAFARAAYEWVRDEVSHSVDAQDPTVTLTATEVLGARVGLCFGKSHLLAALLRANDVPAGLCYQRIRAGDGYVVHGLVAVHLDGAWHRQDPRGNKPGLDAQFSLGAERLAWRADPTVGEVGYPRVFISPAVEVVDRLRGASDMLALCARGLPSELA
jgi:transglutaminase-like putative cysteine protease